MNKLAVLIAVPAVALLGVGAYALSTSEQEVAPQSSRPTPNSAAAPANLALPLSSGLRSFEFLGCSGDWEEDSTVPQAWRAGRKDKVTFLIRHPADCGYTIGSDAKAKISGSKVDLSYAMSNESGDLAACYCEYWASFELLSAPQRVTQVSINGETAKLMGDLRER